MPTRAEVLQEYHNRKNAPYVRIGVMNAAGKYSVHTNPTNIKEQFENNGVLEFDEFNLAHKVHIEMVRGVIIDKFKKLGDI